VAAETRTSDRVLRRQLCDDLVQHFRLAPSVQANSSSVVHHNEGEHGTGCKERLDKRGGSAAVSGA
jgi:hypothetical protein